RHAVDLLINGQPRLALELGVGLHRPTRMLAEWASDRADGDLQAEREAWLPRLRHHTGGDDAPGRRPERQVRGWLAASRDNERAIGMGARTACDVATLSPVHATASRPGARPIGWRGFAARAAVSAMPLYALGGLAPRDESAAREHGARGIA